MIRVRDFEKEYKLIAFRWKQGWINDQEAALQLEGAIRDQQRPRLKRLELEIARRS